MSSRYRSWLALVLPIGLFGCGDNKATPQDARVDAAPPKAQYNWDEGGEVRLEYITFVSSAAVMNRNRATAFFFDGATGNGYNQFPQVPGCTDYTAKPPDHWPYVREATDKFIDVGQVSVTGGPQQLDIAKITPAQGACSVTTATACFSNADCPATETCTGATNTVDNIKRLYKGPWAFSGQAPGPALDNLGPVYFTADTNYDVTFAGSSTWPAQTFKNAIYMPGAWTPISPGPDVNPVLVADTPMTITYMTPQENNRPTMSPGSTGLAGGEVVLGIFVPSTGDPPVQICIQDNTDSAAATGPQAGMGSMTIPATVINQVRAISPLGGKFIRQHLAHQVQELTDGVTHNMKRIDFIGVWCYTYMYTVQ
jgi:hypothetical protein